MQPTTLVTLHLPEAVAQLVPVFLDMAADLKALRQAIDTHGGQLMERLDELVTTLQAVQSSVAGLQVTLAEEATQLQQLIDVLTAPDTAAQAKVDAALSLAQGVQSSVQTTQTDLAALVNVPPPEEPTP
jgi:hypothetical protein